MKTTLGPGVAVLPGGGGIFKSAAVAVLRMERRLMTTGEITRCVSWAGLWLPSRLLSGASQVALPQLVQLPESQYSLNSRAHGLWLLLQGCPLQGPHQLPGQDAGGHHGISPLHRCQAQAGGLRLHPPTGTCSSPAQQQGRQQGAAGGDGVLACACRRASSGCGSGMQRALCQTTTCWWTSLWGTSRPLSRGSGRVPGWGHRRACHLCS